MTRATSPPPTSSPRASASTRSDAAAGELVRPGDGEVVPVDPGRRLEADPSHLALVLGSVPEWCRPLAEVCDVDGNCAGDTADRELNLPLEGGAGGALREAAAEG